MIHLRLFIKFSCNLFCVVFMGFYDKTEFQTVLIFIENYGKTENFYPN